MGSLKKILPVGIGLVLIILITVTVTFVNKATDRTPSFDNSDKVYVSYDKYKVTYDNLYTLMKNQYGVTELLNMIDEQLYAEEISKVNTSSSEFIEFINEQVFGNKNLSEVDKDDAQDAWDEIINSLKVTGLLTKAQAKDNDYNNLDSAVWTVVKDYYKLPYAREQWAKAEYLKKYQEARDDDNLFDMTNNENSTSSIEAYYDENYTGSVIGLFIPFSSEEAALQMMNKYGINILDKVLSANDGWVSNTYDYYSKEKVEDSDMLTYAQVVETFFKMYNEVYRYLNNGNDIITSSAYEYVLKEELTAKSIVLAIQEALDQDGYGVEISLPTTVVVTNQGEASIKWSVENTKYGNINEDGNKLVGDFSTTDDGELSIKLSFEVTYKEATSKGNVTVDLTGVLNEETNTYESKESAILAVTVDEVEPFFTYELTDEFINNPGGDYFKFSWTKDEATKINSTLANYLSVDSSNLKLENDPTELHESYTIEPVKVGNYYCLILKLKDIEASELFKKDEDGEIVKDDNDDYVIVNQELYDEIVEKKKEELLSDDAINEMIYENRYNHNIKIYDSYLEAIYEYNYKTFYETTLKLTDYNKYKTTKKTKKEVIVSYQATAGDKKSVKEFTALDLFNRLEAKYASSSVATLVENYILISDKALNNIYNPYTNEIYNESDYKNLMNSEINTLRKNFESDYFTYSYLAYYGFTPNFSAKYGWKKFIKDYFVAYSDQELLTVSTYGGTIYSSALATYIDSLYDYAAIKDAMQEDYDDWYSSTVINLLITIDYDYNADDSSDDSASLILDETKHWENDVEDDKKSELSKTQIALAKELASLIFNVANETNAGKLIDQLNAVVTLYNDAAYDYNEDEWNTARANNTSIYDYNYFGKYKLSGLNIKVESAATYDSTSSILEPFADECKKLYQEAANLNLLDKTFDVPLLSSEAFYTDYGYHMIAVTGATSKEDLPTEEEIAIYQAQTLVDAEQESIDDAKENIQTYTESGYNTATYEAELAYHQNRKDHYVTLLKEVLNKYGKDEDYTLDEEATARIEQWYTPVETEFEEGTLVTRSYINTLTNTISKFSFDHSENVNRFTEFLEILLEQCDKEDAK